MKIKSTLKMAIIHKAIAIMAFVLLASSNVFSQVVVDGPSIGYNSADYVEITRVEISDTATVLDFRVTFQPGNWISIPKETYIQPFGSEEKLYIVKTEGIPFREKYTMPPSGVVDYKLYFPLIDPTTEKLDFGEGNKEGSWFIYDIELKEGIFERPLPKSIMGTWYAVDGSKKVTLALYDTLAVYNCHVWHYGQVKQEENQWMIELVNSGAKLSVAIEADDDGNIRFVNEQKKTVVLQREVQNAHHENNQAYSMPVFQEGGEAVYKGFINKYSTRYSPKTGHVHVNNIITGDQESYMVSISPNGYFEIKLPIYYPHVVYVRMPNCNESVFLEPGKEVFHIIDMNNRNKRNLFMGDLAELNAELLQLNTIRFFDYKTMQDTILKVTPEEYKKFCFDIRDSEMAELQKQAETGNYSAKALQIKKTDIEYQAIVNAMSFTMYFEGTYRSKNKVPRQQRELGIEIPQLDSSYFDFLSNENANNELALISSGYNSFINRLKFLEILRENLDHAFYSGSSILFAMTEGGLISLSSEESLVLSEMKKLEDPEQDKLYREFYKRYTTEIQLFNTTYNDTLKQLQQDESFLLWHDIETAFASKGILLSAKEKEMINAGKVAMPKETLLQNKQFAKLHGEAQKAMFTKYNPMIKEYIQVKRSEVKRSEVREEKLQALFGINKGLATDLFASQDLCRGIVEEATTLENDDLLKKLKVIQDPFIAQYVVQANEATKEKLVKNKEKTGYYVNQTPTVESEKLFDALMAKFKGKVVVVDFWATWCGPCRSGMERVKPLKAELEGKDVVFVYITNETSPQGTWENMIPDIKGEHFKLNRDEWNVLSGRFNISGIPHYVLVDKNGIVANNNNLNIHNLPAFKTMLEDFLQK